jgi:hypothetical protein
MSSDIRDILARLQQLEEGAITPVYPGKGLNAQQKKADQLPALFKPKNISPTLSKTPYQQHPMKGKLVGAAEGQEPARNALEEAMQEVEEDMLSKVKRDLTRYLDRLEKKIATDDGQRDRETPALDKLEKKTQIDRDLVQKAVNAVEKATEEVDESSWDSDVAPVSGPEDAADTEVAHGIEDHLAAAVSQPAAPVKTMTMEDGAVLEIHGDESQGFEVRHNGRSLRTRFPKIDHAEMAMKLYQQHKKNQDLSQDYVEER